MLQDALVIKTLVKSFFTLCPVRVIIKWAKLDVSDLVGIIVLLKSSKSINSNKEIKIIIEMECKWHYKIIQKRATHAKCHKEFCNKSFKMLTIKTE